MELLSVLLTIAVLFYASAALMYYRKIRFSDPQRKEVVFFHATIAGTAVALFVIWFCIPALQRYTGGGAGRNSLGRNFNNKPNNASLGASA